MFKFFAQPMKLCNMHPRGLDFFLPLVKGPMGRKGLSFFHFLHFGGEKEKESILLGVLFFK